MNMFIHAGNTVTLTAPFEVFSGDAVLIGALFGVAKAWASEGDTLELDVSGVFDLQRVVTETWQVGDRVYWNRMLQAATREAEGNLLIGVAVQPAKDNSGPTGRVRLSGGLA